MKRLWVAAALAPLSFAASGHALANTTISASTTTTPVTTATDGNITVDSGVAFQPPSLNPAVTTAITVNSNATPASGSTLSGSTVVVSNAGAITMTGISNAVGILVQGGYTGEIDNTGSITVNETTDYKDTNSDGITDSNGSVLGQFAAGSDRFGIETVGSSVYTGNIDNSGSITIIGENSAGILINSGGLDGGLINSGTVVVTGGNMGTSDITYGIHAIGQINGNVTISGAVTATGKNAVGVELDNTVTGHVEIFGAISATGYESTTAPTNTSVLALLKNQAAEELMQGGSALVIAGSVTSGVSLDAAIAASGTTSAIAGAVITSSGSAPALLIGGSTAITLGSYDGPTTANTNAPTNTAGYGLIIGGTVTGQGLYDLNASNDPVSAIGVSIGGLTANGDAAATVTIANGMSVTGAIEATSVAETVVAGQPNGGTSNATALYIDNAIIPTINVSGTILASSTATVPVTTTAIELDTEAQVASITNTGTIDASITGFADVVNGVTSTGGTEGYATAIQDKSGNLTSVTNYGVILAEVTPINSTDSVNTSESRAVAIDLSANTTSATVTQAFRNETVSTTNSAGTTTKTVYDNGVNVTTTSGGGVTATTITTTFVPSITGDVLLGSGNGHLNLDAGTLTGGVAFGAGQDNSLEISSPTGGAVATTSAGVTLTGTTFTGAIAEASTGELALTINSGTLDMTSPTSTVLVSPQNTSPTQAAIHLSSLTMGSGASLLFTVGATSGSNTTAENALITSAQFVLATGSVNIASGATIGLNFTSKLVNPTVYTLIDAQTGTITLGNVSTALGSLPYLYQGVLSKTTDANGQEITIDVTQKTTAELGLNAAQSAAFSQFYAAFDKTDTAGTGSVLTAVLSQTTKSGFLNLYNEFLPDYSGGAFESLVTAQESLARAETETPAKMPSEGARGWVQEIGFVDNRTSAAVNDYKSNGFGFAGGMESVSGRNAIGIATALVSSAVNDQGRPVGSSQTASVAEIGAYWKSGGEGLNMGLATNVGWAFMQSQRVLLEQSGTADATLYRDAKANWNGAVASATFSMGYRESFGRYFIKPEVLASYVLLYESAYSEHGAGDAVDLTVSSKLNKEAVVQADTVIGASFGDATKWTPELTIGWRQIVSGGPDVTVAHFNGGTNFTLSPDFQQQGGLLARLGLRATGNFADFSANAGGVFRSNYDSYDARATARFLF